MDKVIKNKMGLEIVTSHSSGCKASSEKCIFSNVSSEEVWWYNIRRFLSYSKNCICKFMQTSSWHELFHFRLSFWIGEVWKGWEKITNIRFEIRLLLYYRRNHYITTRISCPPPLPNLHYSAPHSTKNTKAISMDIAVVFL